MTKSELRNYFRNIRQEFASKHNSNEIIALEEELAAQLRDIAEPLSGAVGGYAAMTSEISPALALDRWRRNGRCIALPYFESRQSPMEFREYLGDTVKGPFGIDQPPADAASIDPALILVPLVAADMQGNRIGQGQGHYDRYLAHKDRPTKQMTIGLAWECQIAENLPADPWDEPLDYICTPDRIIRTTP